MPGSVRRRRKCVATQASLLALAVPQVVAHRVALMVSAGANPNARERLELHRMGAEKVAAFGESWNAMAVQMIRANQELALSFMRLWLSPWRGGLPSLARSTQQVRSAALGVVSKGLAPVERRATANAKRLGRAKRR